MEPPGHARYVEAQAESHGQRRALEIRETYVRELAASLHKRGGRADDARLIESRLERWVKERGNRGAEPNAGRPGTTSQSMAQVNLIEALRQATAWKISDEKIKQLKQGCATRVCREHYQVR